MKTGWSEKIRALAVEKYVLPVKRNGESTFSIRVADVLQDLDGAGFPRGNTPQVCNALRTGKFLNGNDLELERAEGPKSLTSTTVVFHYRFKNGHGGKLPVGTVRANDSASFNIDKKDISKDPRWLAFQRLYGSLHDVYAKHGGGEAFLKSMRSEFNRSEKR